MKSFIKRFILLKYVVLAIFIFFSCGEPLEEKLVKKELASVINPEYTEALVVFLSGEVSVYHEDSWAPVETGDLIVKDDILKVEEGSYCEIQFSNTAIVKLMANTEVKISSLFLEPENTNIDMDLTFGTILCKVSKLIGEDSFNVKTNTTVCGVRGTEFLIKEDSEEGTVLAVREGRVAVLPSTVDMKELKQKAGEENKELVSIIKKIEDNAPVIEANQEIIVTREEIAETEEMMLKVNEALDRVIQEEKTTPDETETIDKSIMIEELNQTVEAAVENVKRSIKPPKQVSDERSKELEEIKEMEMVNISLTQLTTSTEKEEIEEEPEEIKPLVKISIIVEPLDSEIYLGEVFKGKGCFSGLYDAGKTLSFNLKMEGFIEQTLQITTEEGNDSEYTVRLEEITIEPISKEEPEKETKDELVSTHTEETEEEKELPISIETIPLKDVIINVKPMDSKIYVNDSYTGTGTFNREYEIGEILNVTLEKEGYFPQTMTIILKKDEEAVYDVQLIAKPIYNSFNSTYANIIGELQILGDKIILADRNGIVSAFNFNGQNLWTISTSNSPNENSYPVIIDNKVYFSGTTEFLIINQSGNVLSEIQLDSDSAHIFGRRIVKMGDKGLFPTNNTVNIVDLNNGQIEKEISIPDGSRMTPAVFNNKIITVNQKGVVIIIDPGEGQIISTIPTSASQPVALTLTITDSNLAIFAGRKGTVVCIDLVKNSIVWEKKLSNDDSYGVFNDLETSNNCVFVYSKDTIFTLALSNGNLLYNPINNVSAPPLFFDNKLYFGKKDLNFQVIDAGSGESIKILEIDGLVTTRPVLYNNFILVGTETGNIIILNSEGL